MCFAFAASLKGDIGNMLGSITIKHTFYIYKLNKINSFDKLVNRITKLINSARFLKKWQTENIEKNNKEILMKSYVKGFLKIYFLINFKSYV